MARRCLALAAVLCLAWSAPAAQMNPNAAMVVARVNIDTLSRFVRELSGAVPVTIDGAAVTITARDHAAPVNYAAEYLCAKLASYGYTVHNQYYGEQGRNIYAFSARAEMPAQYYILSAHYDAFPYLPDAPGADDDASGVATVLEAARLLKDVPSRYGLMFALWDEEEISPGMYGSRHYADSVALVRDDIRGVINCELLGYDGNGDDAMTVHVRPIANSVMLAQAMLDVNTVYGIGLKPLVIEPGELKSDHASFWEREYGALMQVQDVYADFNPGYHSYDDSFSSFSLPYFRKMAQLAIGTVAHLIEAGEPLPVELVSFTAREEGRCVRLRWKTAGERDNVGFDLERAPDGDARMTGSPRTWTRLATIPGRGTTQAPHEYGFDDPLRSAAEKGADARAFLYRLKQIDRDGRCRYSPECRVELQAREPRWMLAQNYPNPFNPSTVIRYEIAQTAPVTLAVYDVLGRRLAVLVDRVQEAGRHSVRWDASQYPGGIYFFRLESGTKSEAKPMLLLR